jgi:hypothetical protein
MAERRVQSDLEIYRGLQEVPSEFKEGFNWTTVVGIFFCGLIMMPGGIYLSLMTGGGLSTAASWVTVILFMEIARRALKPMSKQNLAVLLNAAYAMMAANWLVPGGPLGWLIYRAYLVTSEAARDAGMSGSFPTWFCPKPTSTAIIERTLFHRDWLVPITIVAITTVLGTVMRYTLGYVFFRLTSDVEKLPFPMAAMSAQGTLALAEADQKPGDEEAEYSTSPEAKAEAAEKKKGNRWRIFSLGAMIGIGFGILQVGIPAVSGLFLTKPLFLLPQPFLDTTVLTEGVLPATPTGIVLDLGIVFLGFVLPFWVVIGTFAAIVATICANPVLHSLGILHTWQPGMDTVNTTFSNSIDFWLSFGIGSGVGVAVVSVVSAIRDMRRKAAEIRKERAEQRERRDLWATPAGRGDYPLWIAMALYTVSALGIVILSWWVLSWSPTAPTIGILVFLCIFAFLYTPFISYVNARLLGISGQSVNIPYIREVSFLLSGAKGIDIWLAPVPMDNYGYMAQSFRVTELVGVRFWSLIKTDLVATPVLFVLSFLFWAFIWSSNAIPSEVFPAAQVQWELQTKNDVLLYSSTFVGQGEEAGSRDIHDTEFMKAIHPNVIGGGAVFVIVLFTVFGIFGLPITFAYGMIRGFGNLPHYMILEITGALIGRYYLMKKLGDRNFLKMSGPLLAGYFTGVGLISMATIAMKLIQAAVSSDPF